MLVTWSNGLLFTANALIPIALLVFASGFFPYKPFLPGLARFTDHDVLSPVSAPFDKVIFMVVDALRSDFVYGEESGFAFTHSLIRDGSAVPFTAHATSPTITMPRIKAITTGSVPSYLDVILNFAESDTTSSLANQDTWLAQMKQKGTGKMIMFGDDTWLKLFPETFDRFDGTSSFFVADFTEVDNNVTRHIPEELARADWNTMVLHFLGLDHIGHKAGPRSPNMLPKQREMDGVVRKVYEAMKQQPHLQSALLVLCGDHGMNDAGNHGGSTSGETSAALTFVSPRLRSVVPGGFVSPIEADGDFRYYQKVEQSDVAPTLAGLLGFPVPRNNLGVFIDDFLSLWSDPNDQQQILLQNAKQILDVVTAAFGSERFARDAKPSNSMQPSDAEGLADSWIVVRQQLEHTEIDASTNDEALESLSSWMKQAQHVLSRTASNYDMHKLILGQVIALVAVVLSLIMTWPVLASSISQSSPFLLITIMYGIMMFASSYVEEEHNFWYWATTGWFAYLLISQFDKPSQKRWVLSISIGLSFVLLRVTRRWNQTGQKYAGASDIAQTYLKDHPMLLWGLIIFTYAWFGRKVLNTLPLKSAVLRTGVAIVLTVAAVHFKVAFTSLDAPELLEGIIPSGSFQAGWSGWAIVDRARLVFVTIVASAFWTIFSRLRGRRVSHSERQDTLSSLHALLCLLLATQSRVLSIPLLTLFQLQVELLTLVPMSLLEITTASLLCQYLSFFAFGGTNAISSIDLSSAYNGVAGYNAPAVGLLMFIGNWAGPLFWCSATARLLLTLKERRMVTVEERSPILLNAGGVTSEISAPKLNQAEPGLQYSHLSLLTLFVSTSLLFVMAACTILRTHLFIWTVFSPKYLYSIAWCLGQHLLVNVGFGSALWSLANA